MNFHTQTLSVKTLHTSVQHEVYWWAWPKINVVLCNSLNTLFNRWFLRCTFYASRWPFWIIVFQNNNIIKDKTILFTVNLLNVRAYLIVKTTYSTMKTYTSYVKINHASEIRQMNTTHLTQLISYCLLPSSMGQNMSWKEQRLRRKRISSLYM
jgi:hypothetical protein